MGRRSSSSSSSEVGMEGVVRLRVVGAVVMMRARRCRVGLVVVVVDMMRARGRARGVGMMITN
jgi:hypothetical protein